MYGPNVHILYAETFKRRKIILCGNILNKDLLVFLKKLNLVNDIDF
jgi:hypothetical protein